MHCRYLAETKTLWEHLNSSAVIFHFGASVAMRALMMSLQLRQACRSAQPQSADHACLCLERFSLRLGTVVMSTLRRTWSLVACDGWSLTWPFVTALPQPLGRSPQCGEATKAPGFLCRPSAALASPYGTCSCSEHGQANKYL